jgi:hypothetical protein
MKQDNIFCSIAPNPQPAYSGFHSPVCAVGGGESEDRSGGVRSHQDIRRQDQAPQGQSKNSYLLCFYFIFLLPSVVDPLILLSDPDPRSRNPDLLVWSQEAS